MSAFIRLSSRSSIYETPPWGVLDQPAFLNQVVKGKTYLKPEALLAALKRLEKHMGRQPTVRYGPRLIDLDILFFDDLVLEAPGLTIPHPGLAERAFVLAPLADLAPELIHPVLGKTVRELLEKVNCSDIVKL
jgi:2-amino-4-hydroxy-6-hydroxymethyldihydropteridine diphosphokinase